MIRLPSPFQYLAFALLFEVGGPTMRAGGDEFRGLWVDSFHPGLRSASEVRQVVADARAGHFNALLVEVRRRGDTFYDSRLEPKAVDVKPPNFDPLAELIALAHDTNSGPPLEIHAWMVAFNIWNERHTPPSQPSHPYRLHRDWLTRTDRGTTWDGANYAFDPGHPEVQRHTFNVAMDIVSRYDVDGLHLDYIRYAGPEWGYNEVAVERFKSAFNRTLMPLPNDPLWLQFRRDQVTALVRKIYLSVAAVKPRITISAATIAWAPGIVSDAEWAHSAAYSTVLQDWRAWMEEGILDLNVPMVYFRQQTVSSNDWAAWSTFAKDHRYRRHVAVGTAVYLNNATLGLAQMRSTRNPTPAGNRADGVALFSYAMPTRDRTSRADFLKALTTPRLDGRDLDPLFPTPTNVPSMSWKSAPTSGHLKGVVTSATNPFGIDGATVTLSGTANRSLTADATGFYGVVDLPPGEYVLTASHPGLRSASTNATLAPGAVTTLDFQLVLPSALPLEPPPASTSSPVAR